MNLPKYNECVESLNEKQYREIGTVYMSLDDKTVAIVTNGGKMVLHPAEAILYPVPVDQRQCSNCRHSGIDQYGMRCNNPAWQIDSIEIIPPFVDVYHVCKKWESNNG